MKLWYTNDYLSDIMLIGGICIMRYEIKGNTFPYVECTLDQGEMLKTESGAMSWMDPGFNMETVGGGAGKVLGRMVSGETAFLNHYTCMRPNGRISFASSFPGEIRPVEITPNKGVIIQKKAFLCCTPGVDLNIAFQRKLGAGLFGGEGFIMNRLNGNGLAFLEIDGTCVEFNLQPGEQMIMDTGHLVMMDETCTMDITRIKGAKNILLGGEGLFNTVVTGPGRVYVQSMPMSKISTEIARYIPGK